jgi:gas vesicle protein
MTTNKKLLGIGLFAAGAGIGAAVALLYAPRAGKHTRARIRDGANRAVNRLEEMKDGARNNVAEWVDEAREAANAKLACGKEVVGKVRDGIDEGRARVGEFVKSVTG